MEYYKRVMFKDGEQKKFLKRISFKLELNNEKLAKLVGVHHRTFRDWVREKYSISLPALEVLCKEAKLLFPKNVTIKEPFWYVNNGGLAGAKAVLKKYGYIGGDPEYRKKKWYEWWEKSGKVSKKFYFETRTIVNPSESEKLAEFIGIILGDGGITSRQIRISLNKKDDNDYAHYVAKLAENLFGINPSFVSKGSIWNLTVSRTQLVSFLVEKGLQIGNKVKNQIQVPKWIINNNFYSSYCMRGLIDTDGSFYLEKHPYKDKVYENCVINFTNRSFPILDFVKSKLIKFGFHARKGSIYNVLIGRENEVIRYFNEIGTSNSKHLNKYLQFMNNKYGEVPKWS